MTVKEIFDKYDKTREKIEITIEEMKKTLSPFLDHIVLYGAGSAGIGFLHYLRDYGINPVFFADGDYSKEGKICEGLSIIKPEDIISKAGEDALVIITINTDGVSYCKDFKKALLEGGHQGVHKRLKSLGCKNVVDYTYFRKCFSLFEGGKYNLPSCTDVYTMRKHSTEIESVYNLLEDDESKNTFLKILEFRMLDDSVNIPTYPEEKMYFEYEYFPKREDEVFIDCGACGGSSLLDFLRENGNSFEHYYAIEPDPFNFNKLNDYVNTLQEGIKSKISCVNMALWKEKKEVNYFMLNGPGTFLDDKGPQKVLAGTIDEILQGRKCTYIKMNIEGAEVPALEGARNSIENYKPRLAIMGYHKTEDFWQVPLLIKNYRKDYKIYLRSYMHNIAFAYYAC